MPVSAAPEARDEFPAAPASLPGDAEIAAAAEAALAGRLDAIAPRAFGVAVSGGGDSLALLLAAADHARRIGARVEAATVDHGLRREAAGEAASVDALCARLGVPHAVLTWRGPPRGNLAAAAREARAGLLAGWAAARGLEAIALGHTADDQAETLLMRAARGSGLDGLSGMREVSHRSGALWLRPALRLRREALRAMLRRRGQGWFDDPSNDDEARDRVKARRLLAALGPLGLEASGLAETAERLAEDSDHLREETRALAQRAVRIGGAGEMRLDRAILRAAPPPLRRRFLARALRLLAGAAHPPRQAALAALEAGILGEADLAARTLHGVVVSALGGEVVMHREPAAAAPDCSPVEAWDGRWLIDPGRGDGGGLRVGALGEAGLAALKRAEAEGWRAPAAWRAAPRGARLCAPALRRGDLVVGVPQAGFGPATADDLLPGRLLG